MERGIVCQEVGDCKTEYSGRTMAIDPAMLAVLKAWRQQSQFAANSDWIFASPVQLGGLPWSYPWVWRVFQNAATAAGIGEAGNSHDAPQLSFLARRGGNSDCCAAKAHAPCGQFVVHPRWPADLKGMGGRGRDAARGKKRRLWSV